MNRHPFVQRFESQVASKASRRCIVLVVAVAAVCASSKVSAQYTLTTLSTFNGTNGQLPVSSPLADANGNLYGTTEGGGDLTLNGGIGDGTVFELTPVPEPSSLALGLLAGMALLGLCVKR
jgi:hypothetical protein